MSSEKSSRPPNRPRARVAKGFRDITADEIRGTRAMLATIQKVYESYGFEPVEQPFIEYTDALGKFLPDQDRPNAGVFSFQDDDDQWLSLRYDLTAPLARYVAENQQFLPNPYRSYRQGWVFRNEKPGPGRFRQFMQFDADTVGSASPAADAEVCMMAADTMEALGIPRGQYVMKVNNRKILDGCLENIGLRPGRDSLQRLSVLRAIDKLDRFGIDNVRQLLGKGRIDESGDFTAGAGLGDSQIEEVIGLFGYSVAAGRRLLGLFGTRVVAPPGFETAITQDGSSSVLNTVPIATAADNKNTIGYIKTFAGKSSLFQEGLAELEKIAEIIDHANYSSKQILIDPSVVRGLEYYTGPVFECELLMETTDEKGNPVRFGSVGGGGRYDDLVARFTGQKVPATGFSIGVSRLYSALKLAGKAQSTDELAPVIVTVMDKDRQGDYWRMVQQLRSAGIRAEMFIGTGNMGKQMKYADKRGSPLVIIQGGDEKAKGEVQIKDLRLGSELASTIETREEYASQRLAQVSVPDEQLVATVQKMLNGA